MPQTSQASLPVRRSQPKSMTAAWAADCREIAEIAVAERGGRGLSGKARGDDARDVGALLFGDRRHTGERSVPTGSLRRIADHENLGVSGNRQVRLDRHPSAASGFNAEPLGGGRGGDPGGPDYGAAFEPSFTQHHAVVVAVRHCGAEPDLHAKPLQALALPPRTEPAESSATTAARPRSE